jgi:hypothetical protein
MHGELESNLEVPQSTLDWIQYRFSRSTVRNPILGIIWGKWTTEGDQHWSVGVYNRDTAEGWIVRCPNLEFVIVQDFLLERLNGKILDIDENGVRVREHPSK